MKRLKEMDEARNGWYELTSADAGELLESRPANRNLSEHKAEQISRRIVAKKWKANGESVILDHNGKLLDGQHRLRGCQIAGMPIKVFIVYVPGSAGMVFDTVDTGWARNSAHRFAAEGISSYTVKAALVTTDFRYKEIVSGASRSFKMDHDFALSIYNAEPEAFDFGAKLAMCNKKLRGLIPPSIVGFIGVVGFREGRQDLAESFWDGVSTGANLAPSNAALHLRNVVVERKTAQKHDNKRLLALSVKAWMMFRDKKPVRLLKWDSEREAFPVLAGYKREKQSA